MYYCSVYAYTHPSSEGEAAARASSSSNTGSSTGMRQQGRVGAIALWQLSAVYYNGIVLIKVPREHT